jgi:hypothetical protein
MEIFGLIENMSSFACPHCGESIHLFGEGGGEKTALDYGLTFLGRIPFDPNVVVCGDTGACFQDIHANSMATRAFSEIADTMSRLVQS